MQTPLNRGGRQVSRSAAEMERRIEELVATERFTRERYELYRAKSYGPRPTSAGRLRELDRAWRLAEARLRLARSTKQADSRA